MSHQDDTKVEIRLAEGYSRRDFLARSAATTAGLYALTLREASVPARAQSPGGSPRVRLGSAVAAGTQQLPFWGDTAGWDKPEYYESLQSGHRHNGHTGSQYVNSNFFGDESDALLIRGPAGVLVHSFDSSTGQWMQMPDGPALSDAQGWAPPAIRLHDPECGYRWG